MKKRTALFVPSYDGHIRTFHCIIEKMKETGFWEPCVVFLEGIHGNLLREYSKKYSFPLIPLRFPYRKNPVVGGIAARIGNAWDYYAYLRTVQKEVVQLFDSQEPAFLVTATEGFTDTHFLFEARKRRIPSLCLCSYLVSLSLNMERTEIRKPGLMQTMYNTGLSLAGLPYSEEPLGYADIAALWGKHHYTSFLERGVSPSQLAVIGSPAHDLIFNRLRDADLDSPAVKKLKVGFRIHPNKHVFLFCTQPVAVDGLCTSEEQRFLTEQVIEACNRFDDHVLIIKLHPRETIQQYTWLQHYLDSGRVYIFAEVEADLFDLLNISDIMITQSSSTGLDALLFGRDMVIVDVLTQVKDAMGYVAAGAALNNKETKKKLSSQRQKFIATCIDRFDGRATERVLSLIESMLKERRQY